MTTLRAVRLMVLTYFTVIQDFNVGEGQGVYFANPEGITNIFSRVTGSNSSNIFRKM
ncbi:two-partner secretion domain-containing protein [Nostoc sp.]|uniref:two-partner secretion domain-containing protein n=1 Tax=Nostoc sp. TaxID=1180 RepID=UPI002FF9125D